MLEQMQNLLRGGVQLIRAGDTQAGFDAIESVIDTLEEMRQTEREDK